MELVEEGPYRFRIPQRGQMRVPGIVYASRGLIPDLAADRCLRDGPVKYARMLGAAGLARYRELLANAPARQHGQDALWTSLHRAETTHAAD